MCSTYTVHNMSKIYTTHITDNLWLLQKHHEIITNFRIKCLKSISKRIHHVNNVSTRPCSRTVLGNFGALGCVPCLCNLWLASDASNSPARPKEENAPQQG